MAEGKKREYKRSTCMERLKELLLRAEDINADRADYKYLNHIQEIILFGSLINTEKQKVHDIDIYVVWDDDRNRSQEFNAEHAEIIKSKFSNMVDQLFGEYFLAMRYLKGGCGIFSIHSNVEEGNERMLPIVKSDRHLYLMSDYRAHFEAIDEIPQE